jgi:hypothetical protein
MLNRELFDAVGGYSLPSDLKMGYFSKIFCQAAAKTNLIRKQQYLLDPYFAEQMDRNNPRDSLLPPPKLSQDYKYEEYNRNRHVEKTRHKSLANE